MASTGVPARWAAATGVDTRPGYKALHAAEAFRRHADDGHGVSVERDRAPHYIRIAVEPLLPVVVAKNNHRVPAQDLSFTAQEQPPGSGLQSKPLEEVTADVT